MIQILKSAREDNFQHQNSTLIFYVWIPLSCSFTPSTNSRVSADRRSGITSNWNKGASTCIPRVWTLFYLSRANTQWSTFITIHISWFASDIINYSNLLRTNYLQHISRPISKSPQSNSSKRHWYVQYIEQRVQMSQVCPYMYTAYTKSSGMRFSSAGIH